MIIIIFVQRVKKTVISNKGVLSNDISIYSLNYENTV